MTLNSPDIELKLNEWQDELRQLTGNDKVILVPYVPIKFEAPEGLRSAQFIIETVCAETGIDTEDIQKKTRKREVVIARQLVAYYCKACSGLSLKRIGQLIGGRDHTTVIHSVNTINDMLQTRNPQVCGAVAKINKRLEESNNTHPE